MNIHAVGVHTARPAEGGCRREVSAERFETPLVGRAACFWRRGGNPPAPAFPRRGKRERGRSNLLAAAGICLRITPEYRQLTPSPQALTATQKPEFPLFKKVSPGIVALGISERIFCAISGSNLAAGTMLPGNGVAETARGLPDASVVYTRLAGSKIWRGWPLMSPANIRSVGWLEKVWLVSRSRNPS